MSSFIFLNRIDSDTVLIIWGALFLLIGIIGTAIVMRLMIKRTFERYANEKTNGIVENLIRINGELLRERKRAIADAREAEATLALTIEQAEHLITAVKKVIGVAKSTPVNKG